MSLEKPQISQEELRAEVREMDRKLAELRAKSADLKCGKRQFFSWPVFGLGLIVVAGLVAPFVVDVSVRVSFFSAAALVAVIAWRLGRNAKRIAEEAARDST